MGMDFIEGIRKRLGVKSKYAMAKLLNTTPQAYETLLKANDRIRLRDLIALRRVSGLTDRALLDLIEKKVIAGEREALRGVRGAIKRRIVRAGR